MPRTTPMLVLALSIPLLTGCGGTADERPIHLGIAGPMELASGRSMRQAAQMAADEINGDGGIDGRPLALVLRDDEADPTRAIEVAEELREDARIAAVVGHINSSATLAAAEVYNDETNGVIEISPASSSPRVSAAGSWTFRVCPSDLRHGPALARWAADGLGARRIAVLYSNDAYGRGVLESFDDAIDEFGAELVTRDPYVPSAIDSADALDPYLERGMLRGMDALVIAGQAEEAETIVRAARRLGYQGPIMGADGITSLIESGSIAEGVYVSSAFLPDRPTEPARRFVRRYVDRFGEAPDHRGAMTYDAVHLLARALRAVGPDRTALRDYMAGVGRESASFDGVSGSIAFDQRGDAIDKPISVGVIRDGSLVTAGS